MDRSDFYVAFRRMGNSCRDSGELEIMRTTCPTCDTAYTVPDERIGAKGRKVRCTRCGEEWRVFAALAEPSVDPRPAPVPKPAPPPLADPFEDLDVGAFDDAPPARETSDSAFVEPTSPPMPDEVDAPAEAPPEPPVEAAQPAPAAATHPAKPSAFSRLVGRMRGRPKRRRPSRGHPVAARLATYVTPLVGPAVFLAACLVVTGTWVFRQTIVAAAPDLAGLYSALGAPVNLRGLVFGRIETLREIDNGQPVLVVEGSLSNATKQMREVPALRFALRGPDTQELYAWSIDPKSTTIESGDTIRFRTRLAAPPDQATEVQVRFVERRSQHAGLP